MSKDVLKKFTKEVAAVFVAVMAVIIAEFATVAYAVVTFPWKK